jgi:hypothetical protein
MPAEQRVHPTKTRGLKKADREVEFVFMASFCSDLTGASLDKAGSIHPLKRVGLSSGAGDKRDQNDFPKRCQPKIVEAWRDRIRAPSGGKHSMRSANGLRGLPSRVSFKGGKRASGGGRNAGRIRVF